MLWSLCNDKCWKDMTAKFDIEIFLEALLYTFILGIIVHAACFLNMFYSHDSLYVGLKNEITWKVSIGRYIQPAYYLIKGTVISPWLYGLFSLFWLACANYLLIKIFNVQNKLSKICITALIVTELSFAYTNATFIHESDNFALAMFLSVLAAYSLYKSKYNFIVTPLLITLTCGIYQAFFSVTLVLVMVYAIIDILKNPDTKTFMFLYLKYIGIMIFGLVLYFVAYYAVLLVTGIQPAQAYNSVNNLLEFKFQNYINLFFDTYRFMVWIFLKTQTEYKTLSTILDIIILLSYIAITWKASSSLSIVNRALLFIILTLLPFGANIAMFFAKGVLTIQLTTSSSVILYVYLFLTVFNYFYYNEKKVYYIATSIVFFVICFSNFIYINQIYVQKELSFNNTLSVFTKITNDIENIPGYIYNKTPVVFVGLAQHSSNLNITRPGFEHIIGPGIVSIGATFDIKAYYENILSYRINIANKEDTSYYTLLNEVEKMPLYPSYGSIKKIGKVIIVKLSDKS